MLRRYIPSKNGRRSDRWPQKTKKLAKPRPAPLRASPGPSTFDRFTWLGLQNRPTIRPLNIVIIPWQQLGHTVLIFKYGSHFRVQSRMKPCIQSCTGVKKRFETLQTHTDFLLLIAASIQYWLDRQP